jgi:hypothetical protein
VAFCGNYSFSSLSESLFGMSPPTNRIDAAGFGASLLSSDLALAHHELEKVSDLFHCSLTTPMHESAKDER